MKAFPVQYYSFRKTREGDNLLTFRVDARFSQDISELIEKDINTEFMIQLEQVSLNLPHKEEKTVGLKEKLWKKMHSLIHDAANYQGKNDAEIKEELRGEMVKEGFMEKSTKELDIKGLTKACEFLESMI